ncbi:MAG: tetratricopeptide repeat protein [Elusimicrobia bacterium]|nr:tetratricopeptide repeat protein [Elusimicrobiota bacterium]
MKTKYPLSAALAVLCLSGCARIVGLIQHEDPLSAEEHLRLGHSYEEQGLHSSSAKEYGAALRKDKGFLPAIVALGNLAYKTGSLLEAEIYYLRALKISPDHPSANNNLAVVYLTRGSRLDKAEALAKAALKKAGPLEPYVLDTLANIYLRQGRLAEARRALDAAEAVVDQGNTKLREHLIQTRRYLEAFMNERDLKGPLKGQLRRDNPRSRLGSRT